MDDYNMAKEQKEFVFPPEILERINECSNGGFVLFTFGSDGYPACYSAFDAPQLSYGMQNYIKIWASALNELQQASIQQDILDSIKKKNKKK